MRWDKDDIITQLKNDYVIHYNKYHHFQRNDNEVDALYEGAVCDYIFDTLVRITDLTPGDIAEQLDEQIEGVFLFSPQENPLLYRIKIGDKVSLYQDVYYTDYESLRSMFDDEDRDILFQEFLYVDSSNNEVYIPKGTHMTYLGLGEGPGAFPKFDVHGFELEFAGNPFKIKKV